MAHERRRAALAALCVLAVALAATLFPASGFGSQPAGVGLDSDGPDGTSGSESGPVPSPNRTADQSPTATTTEQDSDSDGGTTTGTTRTTTPSETTTAVGESGPSGPDSLLTAFVLTALGLVGLLCVVGFWTGTLAVTTTAASATLLPFTVVVAGTPLGELVGRVPTRTMALVVGISSSVPRLLDDAADLTRAVAGSLADVLGGAGRASADVVRIGASGLAATVAAVPRALAGLGAGAGIFASLGSVGVPSIGGRSRSDDADSATGPRPDDPEETGPPSVEEAWQAFRDRVPVGDPATRTPGEVARTAVRRGYPDEAVRRLTDAFREVRYGDLPREDRTESARTALDRLRDYWRGDGSEDE